MIYYAYSYLIELISLFPYLLFTLDHILLNIYKDNKYNTIIKFL